LPQPGQPELCRTTGAEWEAVGLGLTAAGGGGLAELGGAGVGAADDDAGFSAALGASNWAISCSSSSNSLSGATTADLTATRDLEPSSGRNDVKTVELVVRVEYTHTDTHTHTHTQRHKQKQKEKEERDR
jgi:hypothetical protein